MSVSRPTLAACAAAFFILPLGPKTSRDIATKAPNAKAADTNNRAPPADLRQEGRDASPPQEAPKVVWTESY